MRGRLLSDSTRCGSNLDRGGSRSSRVLTTFASNASPARRSSSWTSSASDGTSSRIRMRSAFCMFFLSRRLIEDHPVQTEVRHGLDELVEFDGLLDVAVHTEA